jgi:hypothetical protein
MNISNVPNKKAKKTHYTHTLICKFQSPEAAPKGKGKKEKEC